MRIPNRRPLRLLAVLLVAGMCASAAHAVEGEPAPPDGTGRAAYDLLVLRPLALVQTTVSLPLFLLAYPVTLVTGGSEHVVKYCLDDPVDRTFRRPLGDL